MTKFTIGLAYRRYKTPFKVVTVMAYNEKDALARAHHYFNTNHMQTLMVIKDDKHSTSTDL